MIVKQRFVRKLFHQYTKRLNFRLLLECKYFRIYNMLIFKYTNTVQYNSSLTRKTSNIHVLFSLRPIYANICNDNVTLFNYRSIYHFYFLLLSVELTTAIFALSTTQYFGTTYPSLTSVSIYSVCNTPCPQSDQLAELHRAKNMAMSGKITSVFNNFIEISCC